MTRQIGMHVMISTYDTIFFKVKMSYYYNEEVLFYKIWLEQH